MQLSRQPVAPPAVLRILLVEDDDGDALLVEEYLRDAAEMVGPVELVRARRLAEAIAAVSLDTFDCILLDLGLPDAEGLSGLTRLRENAPKVAHVVLTGLADSRQGLAAMSAGAQDYLAKAQVDGELLARSLRYAIKRHEADESERQLHEAKLHAAENARLERGLLPRPLLSTSGVTVHVRSRPGRRRALLGGDFYDVVQGDDGVVRAVIGDVSGHGADEAALGVCLRVARRTLVLAGAPEEAVLQGVEQILIAERPSDETFATSAMVAVDPASGRLGVWLAGHPAPLHGFPGGPIRQLLVDDAARRSVSCRAARGPSMSTGCCRESACCSLPTASSRVARRTATGWGTTVWPACSHRAPGPQRRRTPSTSSSMPSRGSTVSRCPTPSPSCGSRSRSPKGSSPRVSSPRGSNAVPDRIRGSMRRRLALVFAVVGTALLALLLVAAVSVARVYEAEQRLTADLFQVLREGTIAYTATLDQETGVRGYLLTGDTTTLQPYERGLDRALAADERVRAVLSDDEQLVRLYDEAVRRADLWRSTFAETAITAVQGSGPEAVPMAEVERGQVLFDDYRAAFARYDSAVLGARQAAEDDLERALRALVAVLVTGGVGAVLVAVLLWVALRMWVTDPLERLAGQTRLVAAGEVSRQVRPAGPAEIAALGAT